VSDVLESVRYRMLKAEADLAAARAALLRYGRHDVTCSGRYNDTRPCTCGFGAITPETKP
jgi:hypothetical protein